MQALQCDGRASATLGRANCNKKGVIILESETTLKIKAYSTDERGVNAYEALLAYYGKHGLHEISESQGQAFLKMLRNGDVRL